MSAINVKSVILDNCSMVVSTALAQINVVIVWTNSRVCSERSNYSPLVLNDTKSELLTSEAE